MSATTRSQLLLLHYFSLNLFLFDLTEHSFVEGGSPNVLILRRPVDSSSKTPCLGPWVERKINKNTPARGGGRGGVVWLHETQSTNSLTDCSCGSPACA